MRNLNWSVHQYNQWLLEKIRGYDVKYSNYYRLLQLLFSIPYRYKSYKNGTDRDRYRDGMALRNEYAESSNDFYILEWEEECTVLEMLIALAVKIDWVLMGVPDKDNGYWWFWLMIKNLDLHKMTDDRFDEFYILQTIDGWLDRDIGYNGEGGLFPLHETDTDQRYESTWQQMNNYLLEMG